MSLDDWFQKLRSLCVMTACHYNAHVLKSSASTANPLAAKYYIASCIFEINPSMSMRRPEIFQVIIVNSHINKDRYFALFFCILNRFAKLSQANENYACHLVKRNICCYRGSPLQ
jgi:hypothetical protein